MRCASTCPGCSAAQCQRSKPMGSPCSRARLEGSEGQQSYLWEGRGVGTRHQGRGEHARPRPVCDVFDVARARGLQQHPPSNGPRSQLIQIALSLGRPLRVRRGSSGLQNQTAALTHHTPAGRREILGPRLCAAWFGRPCLILQSSRIPAERREAFQGTRRSDQAARAPLDGACC